MNREEQISQSAYFKWEEAGRPEGRDGEFWSEAEKEFEDKNPQSECDFFLTPHMETITLKYHPRYSSPTIPTPTLGEPKINFISRLKKIFKK